MRDAGTIGTRRRPGRRTKRRRTLPPRCAQTGRPRCRVWKRFSQTSAFPRRGLALSTLTPRIWSTFWMRSSSEVEALRSPARSVLLKDLNVLKQLRRCRPRFVARPLRLRPDGFALSLIHGLSLIRSPAWLRRNVASAVLASPAGPKGMA